MCGIAGFTRSRSPGAGDEAIIRRMQALLAHRGPDAQGFHLDPAIAITQTRLSVIDLAGGQQPRVEGNGALLVYNGEIYGFAALAEELRRDGVTLRDASDTEVLFQLLLRDGALRTLQRIDGMFAFAYRDPEGTLWLARDRFGEKPLYYALLGETLAFGSELAVVRAHPVARAASINPDELQLFLALQYLPDGRTGLASVRKINPGCVARFQDGMLSEVRYWDHPAPLERPDDRSEADLIEGLESLLHRSVADRLISDVPIGIFLSGGLDSSILAAFARRVRPDLASFSIRFDGEASFDESPYAETVARHLGLRHTTIPLGRDTIASAFIQVLDRLDELLADSSILPTYLLSRETRRHVTVALGGDGADELFLGYPNFKVRRLAEVMALLPARAGSIFRSLSRLVPDSGGYMSNLFRLRQLSFGFGQNPDAQSLFWMQGLGQDDRARIWRQDGRHSTTAPMLEALAVAHDGESGNLNPVERLCRLFLRGYLPDSVLAKVDRASMAHALEVRAPFLGRDLAEFALTLPTLMKLRGKSGKYLLRQVGLRHLPREIVERPKHGFAVPLADLFRKELKAETAGILLETPGPAQHLLHRPGIEALWREHLSGRRDNSRQIWTLCVLAKVTAGWA